MSTRHTSGSTPPDASSDPLPEARGAATAAGTIRAALREKALGASVRRGSGGYGNDQRPPPPPFGTRRSMGKR